MTRTRRFVTGCALMLASAALQAQDFTSNPNSIFAGCENKARAPEAGEEAVAPAPPVVDRFTERAFASFTMDDVERGAAKDLNALCWARLDGVWRTESPIILAENLVDETIWGAAGPDLMKLANGNFTTPRHLVIVASPSSDDALFLTRGLQGENFVRFTSSDGIPLTDVLKRGGAVKTYQAAGAFPWGNNLRINVSRSGRIRLNLGGNDFFRPEPNNTLEIMATQEPANHPFLLPQNLGYLPASRRGYDVAMQDPLYLYQNNKQEIFAQLDPQKYYTTERHIVPVNLHYIPESGQGTVYRKSLISSEQHIQETASHSFGAQIGFTARHPKSGETIGGASAGYSSTKTTSTSMSTSSTTAQAVGFSRHKKYALVVDHPYVQLSDAFIDAVEDARMNHRYQALINKFGTHYPYAVTFGATARMTVDMDEESYRQQASKTEGFAANAGASNFGVNGAVNVSEQSGESTSTSGKMVNEKATFVAVGGNGSWDQNGYSAGDDHYPILMDLRPIPELLNPMNFPGEPQVYIQVRKNLEKAIERYLIDVSGNPPIETLSWLPEVEVAKPEPEELWYVYVRRVWCDKGHPTAKSALASKLTITGYTGTGANRKELASTVKTDGLVASECSYRSPKRTTISYGSTSPGLIQLRGTRSELRNATVELEMEWHYNSSSHKKRSAKKTIAGKLFSLIPDETSTDEVWMVTGTALPDFKLLVRFKRKR